MAVTDFLTSTPEYLKLSKLIPNILFVFFWQSYVFVQR